jgi:hypothetical protein
MLPTLAVDKSVPNRITIPFEFGNVVGTIDEHRAN